MTSTSRKHRAARAARRQWTPADGASVFVHMMAACAAAVSQAPLSRTDLTRWSIEARSAVDAIRVGEGQTSHLADLNRALNLSTVMAQAGLGDEWAEVIKTGGDALRAAADRHATTGQWDWNGDELHQITALVDLLDAQLSDGRMTEAQLLAAVRQVQARIAAGDCVHYTPTPAQTTTTQELRA